jgi:hypothetical protein
MRLCELEFSASRKSASMARKPRDLGCFPMLHCVRFLVVFRLAENDRAKIFILYRSAIKPLRRRVCVRPLFPY